MIRTVRIISCFFLLSILLLLGCATSPPENEIRNQIIKYFETRDYKVIDINIGFIEPTSQREKTHMGTEGYLVKIESITSEATAQNPQFHDKKEQRLIYRNGSIRIKRGTGQWKSVAILHYANKN